VDLRLYGRVISRFRYLVAGGVALAVVLTFLTMFKVGAHGVAWRQQKTYQATEKLLLDNLGGSAASGLDAGTVIVLDAEVANGDVVRRLATGTGGPLGGKYVVTAVSGGSAIGPLPLLEIDAFAHQPRTATAIATRVAEALRSYLPDNVPGNSRVVFRVTSSPNHPIVSQGRKFTVPIVILISILVVTFGLAFLLENLRPRVAPSLRELEPTPGPVESGEKRSVASAAAAGAAIGATEAGRSRA